MGNIIRYISKLKCWCCEDKETKRTRQEINRIVDLFACKPEGTYGLNPIESYTDSDYMYNVAFKNKTVVKA